VRAGEEDWLLVDGDVERPRRTAERSGRVADLLRAAKPVPGADHATFHSGDGLYRASIPLEELGRAELEDGRLTVPGGQTKCWNVKDVVRIEVTIGARPDSVPANPPH